MSSRSAPENPPDKLSLRIRARAASLSPALVRVLDYIDANRLDAMTKSAVELGTAIGTSDATVIRAIQALGFDGLKDLKREIVASFGQGHSAADNMSRTFSSLGDERATAVDTVLSDHRQAFDALCSEETRLQLSDAVKVLSKARRVGVFGIGPSAFLAGYFSLQLSRSGRPSRLFDGSGAPLPDQLLHMPEVDAIVMLAYGRPYKEATACITEAKRQRKPIVLITDARDNGMSSDAKVVVAIHRGEGGRVALHAATLVGLEAIVIALASQQKTRTIEMLERLNELRKSVGKAPQ